MSEQEFVIEEVTDLDAAWPELAVLLRGIIDYHAPFDARVLRADWEANMKTYMRSVQAKSLNLLARDAGGRPAGFLCGSVGPAEGIFEETAGAIDNAFLEAPYRGRGLGSALLNRFEAWCRDSGATVVRLDVTAGNRLGFEFWQHSGFEVDHYVMSKAL